MNIKSKVFGAILYVSLLVFITFVVYILYINQEVLYTAHDRSEFLIGTPFFHTLISKPFGLMQYAGAWLTQFCYEPVMGAAMLIVIWAMIFFVGVKAFKLQGKSTGKGQDNVKMGAAALMLLPIACLLTSIVDLGYWIYIYTIRGYWFSQSLAYLFMLLLLWAASSTPRKWHLIWYVLGVFIYPVLGWYALLFVLCLIVSGKITWRELVGVILLLFTVVIWYTQFYSHLKFDDVILAGLPRFITASNKSEHLTTPFLVLGVVSMLIPLFSRYLSKVQPIVMWLVPVVCSVAGIIFTCSLMFHDRNYINEMRMVRYAETDNWQEVLNIADKTQKPTTTMIFLKNIALMNEGGLLDRSFKKGNIGYPIYNPYSINVTLLDIASPLVYYNYGMTNEAIRLNFEKGIQVGFSPFYLKTLARCALAKGDKKLLERYTTLLHHHPFYSDWQPAPVSAKVNELQKSFPDEITGVENSDSYIVNSVSLWYEADSKTASEQALFYSVLRCNSHLFWTSLRKYLKMHEGEEFPVHAQEAYILFMDKAPEEKRMKIPVELSVYERYKQFSKKLVMLVKPGKTIGTVAEEMLGEWGDTYWYYYYFGRQYTNTSGRKVNEVQS